MEVVSGDERAKQDLEQLLAGFGLTLDVVTTFGETIVSQLHTDRMVAAAYERRNAAYAELERRQAKSTKAPTTLSEDDRPEIEAPQIGGGTVTAGRAESRPRESEQDDKWSFCLTAGTLCLANQERR
jgi:hypothetical protein